MESRTENLFSIGVGAAAYYLIASGRFGRPGGEGLNSAVKAVAAIAAYHGTRGFGLGVTTSAAIVGAGVFGLEWALRPQGARAAAGWGDHMTGDIEPTCNPVHGQPMRWDPQSGRCVPAVSIPPPPPLPSVTGWGDHYAGDIEPTCNPVRGQPMRWDPARGVCVPAVSIPPPPSPIPSPSATGWWGE